MLKVTRFQSLCHLPHFSPLNAINGNGLVETLEKAFLWPLKGERSDHCFHSHSIDHQHQQASIFHVHASEKSAVVEPQVTRQSESL